MKGNELIKEKLDADKEAFRQKIQNTQHQINCLKSAIEDKQNKLKGYEEENKRLLNMTLTQWKKETRKEG